MSTNNQVVSLVKVQEVEHIQTMRFSAPVLAYVLNIAGLLWGTYIAMQMNNSWLLVLETLTFGLFLGMLIGRKRGNGR